MAWSKKMNIKGTPGTTTHAGLTDVTADQHHARFTNAEAVTAMGAEGDGNALHHRRFTDVEVKQALGARADSNQSNHNRYTDEDAAQKIARDNLYLKLTGGTMNGAIDMHGSSLLNAGVITGMAGTTLQVVAQLGQNLSLTADGDVAGISIRAMGNVSINNKVGHFVFRWDEGAGHLIASTSLKFGPPSGVHFETHTIKKTGASLSICRDDGREMMRFSNKSSGSIVTLPFGAYAPAGVLRNIHRGTGVPAASLGTTGDVYIETGAHKAYFKEGAAWV